MINKNIIENNTQDTIKTNKTGYCNPPKETQFKKGQSGNPKGRPKNTSNNDIKSNNSSNSKHFNITSILAKELNSKITMADGKKLPKLDILIKQTINNGISAKNVKDQKQILEMLTKLENKNIYDNFINRLIQNNYITEEQLKEFASYNKPLNVDNMESVVRATVVNRYVQRKGTIDAFYNLRIALHELIGTVLFYEADIIVKKIIEEAAYREGVEDTLDILKLSYKTRSKVLDEIENTRIIPEPPIEVFKAAYLIQIYINKLQIQYVIDKETKLKQDSMYEEVLQLDQDEESIRNVIKGAKKISTKEDYENFLKVYGTKEARDETDKMLNAILELGKNILKDDKYERILEGFFRNDDGSDNIDNSINTNIRKNSNNTNTNNNNCSNNSNSSNIDINNNCINNSNNNKNIVNITGNINNIYPEFNNKKHKKDVDYYYGRILENSDIIIKWWRENYRGIKEDREKK